MASSVRPQRPNCSTRLASVSAALSSQAAGSFTSGASLVALFVAEAMAGTIVGSGVAVGAGVLSGVAVGCAVGTGVGSGAALGISTQLHSRVTTSKSGRIRRKIDINAP